MQGAASYSGDHLTAIVTGNRIAPDFPLSQFQLRLFDGTALTGTITERINSRLAASIAYEYHGTPSRSFLPAPELLRLSELERQRPDCHRASRSRSTARPATTDPDWRFWGRARQSATTYPSIRESGRR